MNELIKFARGDLAEYLATSRGAPPKASKAEVMVAAAAMVIGLPYALGGDGRDRIDGFGFIRWSARAAAAWTDRGIRLAGDFADASVDRHRFASLTGEPDADLTRPYLEAWGMVRVNEVHPIRTLPGDVVLSLGNGPGAVIVMQGRDHLDGELVAGVWARSAPQVRADAECGRSRVRVYRWPAAGGVG